MATHSRNLVTRPAEKDLRVSPVTLDDLPAVYEIESRSMPFGWSSHIFKSCLVGPYECWKIEKHTSCQWDVIGYYVLYLLNSHAELCNLCVDVDKQRLGYGTQLLTHAIERCETNGIESLALDVRKSNLVAKKLYTGFGFKKVGLRKSYYAAAIGREDAEVMELCIGNSVPPDSRVV